MRKREMSNCHDLMSTINKLISIYLSIYFIFWYPSFHTEENWETHLQLLQKMQTLTDAPEGTKYALRAREWKLLNRMNMCIFFMFYLNIIFFFIKYCPSEATKDSYMFSRRQIKLNLPWSPNSNSFHAPAINACSFFWSISECLNFL